MIAAAVVIAAHGLIHLMGMALLWKLGEPGGLRYADAMLVPGSAAAVIRASRRTGTARLHCPVSGAGGAGRRA